MARKLLMIPVLLCALGGSPVVLAQQAQSVAPGQALPPEVKLFQGLEDKWSIALVNKDQFTMDLLLSPLYAGISSTGEVFTRNQQIADMFDKTRTLISLQQRVISVRMFGDTAIVSGTFEESWRSDGPVQQVRGIFTNVFVQSQARWQCVNAQQTPVASVTPAPEKSKKSKRKK